MAEIDVTGMRRLAAITNDAISKQPTALADQLDAALRDGDASFRVVDGGEDGPVVLVTVGGHEVAAVDVVSLVDGVE